MTELKELLDLDELNEVWETSRKKPVLLFKQSTTCPVSAEAFRQFNSFLETDHSDIKAYFVKVRESRAVSDEIAEELKVEHQSPQIFIVKDREQIWNTSHGKITVENIKEALKGA